MNVSARIRAAARERAEMQTGVPWEHLPPHRQITAVIDYVLEYAENTSIAAQTQCANTEHLRKRVEALEARLSAPVYRHGDIRTGDATPAGSIAEALHQIAGICSRPDGHDGACNGHPRERCPGSDE